MLSLLTLQQLNILVTVDVVYCSEKLYLVAGCNRRLEKSKSP